MLAVRLLGGLGNQLFQVAFAHRLVQLGHRDVVLETSSFRRSRSDTPRVLEVDGTATGLRMVSMPWPLEVATRRLREPWHLHERAPGDDVLDRVSARTRLITGYYQNWQLAEATAEPMARVFAHHTHPVAPRSSFVAVHSRLGDYLAKPATLQYHGVTSPRWLLDRARGLQRELGAEHVRVFTDSPGHFVALAGDAMSDDLVFDESAQAWDVISSMQHAQGFVISNSTLSWWAAFASRHFVGADAPVIAPLPWFAEASVADRLLVAPDWRPMTRDLVGLEQATAVWSAAAPQADDAMGSRVLHRSELVVCTRNRSDDLRSCLLSVAATMCPPERVLVVDSSDDDRAERLVDEFRPSFPVDIDYVRGPQGLTLQRNVGLDLLRPTTEVVHFLDDDVVLEADYFMGIDAAFATDSAIAGVGGRITDRPTLSPSRVKSLLMLSGPQGAVLRSGHNVGTYDLPAVSDVENLSGCSMSYRVARIAGLRFDVRRAGYGLGEDVDFSLRANARGRLVWTPHARLEHHQGDRGDDFYFAMARAGVRNRWMLATDRLGRVRRVWVVYATLAWVVAGAVAALSAGDLGKARRYRAGLDGLVDLVRERRRRSLGKGAKGDRDSSS